MPAWQLPSQENGRYYVSKPVYSKAKLLRLKIIKIWELGRRWANYFLKTNLAKVEIHLTIGWGMGNILDLKLSFLHGPDDQH